MASLMPNGKQQFFNSAGKPLSGGKLYTYSAGTSTPKATYSDSAGTVPNANPIILDARGEAMVYWSGSYKVALQDSLGNAIYTTDNYAVLTASTISNVPAGGISATTMQAALNELDTKKQANLGFTPQPALGYTPVNRAGDTMLGPLSTYYTTGTIAAAAGASGMLQVQSNGAGDAAFMTFVRQGFYGQMIGIDTDNQWKVGGFSAGAVSYKLLHSGNYTTLPYVASSLNAAAATYLTGNVIGSYIATNYGMTPNSLGYPGTWVNYNQTNQSGQNTILGWVRTA